MRVLLDTHILLWALADDPCLPAVARTIIADESNAVFYSTASAWEVSIKHGLHPDRMKASATFQRCWLDRNTQSRFRTRSHRFRAPRVCFRSSETYSRAQNSPLFASNCSQSIVSTPKVAVGSCKAAQRASSRAFAWRDTDARARLERTSHLHRETRKRAKSTKQPARIEKSSYTAG